MDVKTEMKNFNPGAASVSNIAHDPRVALHVLNEMLLPYTLTNQLTIHLNTKVLQVVKTNRLLQEVVLKNTQTDSIQKISADYFIDAIEVGDMLPLANVEYVTGAEAKSETDEAHAVETSNPNDIQAFTYVLGMEYRDGEEHTIPEPDMYAFWKTFPPTFGRINILVSMPRIQSPKKNGSIRYSVIINIFPYGNIVESLQRINL